MAQVEWPDANTLFEQWQGQITGWESFQSELNLLTSVYADQRFVWRGQSDARWGLHSSLYLKLADLLGAPPSEGQLVQAEKNLLKIARTEWRLDGISALELFARMQHVGVPTRLIDVSFNPLIAAWFAVARNADLDHMPGRLLVFTDGDSPIQLNSRWKTNTPRWHLLRDDHARRAADWGTGLGRKVWRPPVLHDRISTQNAAFILDGVPITSLDAEGSATDHRATWAAYEVQQFASVPMRLAHIGTDRLPRKAPVFTFFDHARRKARDTKATRATFRLSIRYCLRRHRRPCGVCAALARPRSRRSLPLAIRHALPSSQRIQPSMHPSWSCAPEVHRP
jgi:hypothetical protein